MIEWMMANPGWTTLGAVVIVLAAFGLVMLMCAIIGAVGFDDMDAKYHKQKEARRKTYDQIYKP